MSLTLKTAASTLPVSVADAKLHARITDSAEDATVTLMLQAAVRAAEVQMQSAIMSQTWYLSRDRFNSDRYSNAVIEIPMPPLQSVTSITYIDADGNTQTLAPSEYVVDTRGWPGRVMPAYGKVWPITQPILNAVTIEFVAGNASAANVQDDIKHGIKLIFGHLWEHREEVSERQLFDVPLAARRLLYPHRVHSFGSC